MLTVRPISPADYATVGELMKEGFRMPSAPSEEYVANLCYDEPEGCFLGLEEETPVGFVCTHAAGSVGFLGPLAVSRASRGRGYGRTLSDTATRYLAARCEVVGLATEPSQGNNIGMYYRLGYRETLPSRFMARRLPTEAAAARCPAGVLRGSELDEAQVPGWIDRIRAWTHRIYPGLDLCRDIRLFLERYPDRIFFSVEAGEPRGVLAQVDSFRGTMWGAVEPFPGDGDVLMKLVRGMEIGLSGQELWTHFHTHCPRLTDLFLDMGYRFVDDKTCMLLKTHQRTFTQPLPGLFIRPWWS